MANFNTHFAVSAVSSGMLATLCLQVGFVGTQDALLLSCAGVVGGIFPLWTLFQKFSVHRGAIHSINAALLFSLVSAALSYHIFGKSDFTAWLLALFIFLGFILHLLLDEIYSVDFMGYRLKRSFGSALKLIDFKEPLASASIAIGAGVAWYYSPDAGQFLDTLFSKETYQLILQRMY